jgi:DNA-binding NarL/FixJ family response regulator
MRVLLIDDDRVFSEPIKWQLEFDGHSVEYQKHVSSVVDATGTILVARPDCLIIDIMMPRGDIYSKEQANSGSDTGIYLLRDLQKAYPNVPVIVVTVRDDLSVEVLKEKHSVTVRKVLRKPVAPSRVAGVVAEELLGLGGR